MTGLLYNYRNMDNTTNTWGFPEIPQTIKDSVSRITSATWLTAALVLAILAFDGKHTSAHAVTWNWPHLTWTAKSGIEKDILKNYHVTQEELIKLQDYIDTEATDEEKPRLIGLRDSSIIAILDNGYELFTEKDLSLLEHVLHEETIAYLQKTYIGPKKRVTIYIEREKWETVLSVRAPRSTWKSWVDDKNNLNDGWTRAVHIEYHGTTIVLEKRKEGDTYDSLGWNRTYKTSSSPSIVVEIEWRNKTIAISHTAFERLKVWSEIRYTFTKSGDGNIFSITVDCWGEIICIFNQEWKIKHDRIDTRYL